MSQHQRNKSGGTSRHYAATELKRQMKLQKLGKYLDARTSNERHRILKQMVEAKKRQKATTNFLKGAAHEAS